MSSAASAKEEKLTTIGTPKRTITTTKASNKDGNSDCFSFSGKTKSQPMLSPMKRTEFWKSKRKNADNQS